MFEWIPGILAQHYWECDVELPRNATSLSPKRQELLYLQAEQTRVTFPVMGMSIFENGKFSDGPRDPDDWPYQTVSQAMQDGWRIIKFPEMALLVDEKRTYGLGCEFILERWR